MSQSREELIRELGREIGRRLDSALSRPGALIRDDIGDSIAERVMWMHARICSELAGEAAVDEAIETGLAKLRERSSAA